MEDDGVLLPRFHLRSDEELVVGLDLAESGESWNLRFELLLKVSDKMAHRYGPVWIDPAAVEAVEPDKLEEAIRTTLAESGFASEPVESDTDEPDPQRPIVPSA